MIHAWRPSFVSVATRADSANRFELDPQRRRDSARACRRAGRLSRCRSRSGPEVERPCSSRRRRTRDLVVVGSRGLGSLKRLLLAWSAVTWSITPHVLSSSYRMLARPPEAGSAGRRRRALPPIPVLRDRDPRHAHWRSHRRHRGAAGWRILTDPTFDPPGRTYKFGWGSKSTKLSGPALEPDEVGPIDAVLVSHDHHGDNLDDSGRALLAAAPMVITTKAGARRLGSGVRGLDPWDVTRLEATASQRSR